MTDTTVATDIHQSFDIELYDRAALALDLNTARCDDVTDCTDLLVCPILYFEVIADACLVENLASGAATDTVDIGQTALASLIFW